MVRLGGFELPTFWFVASKEVAVKTLTCLFGFAYEKNEAALLLASCTKDARNPAEGNWRGRGIELEAR
jgi:hypothetical protein